MADTTGRHSRSSVDDDDERPSQHHHQQHQRQQQQADDPVQPPQSPTRVAAQWQDAEDAVAEWLADVIGAAASVSIETKCQSRTWRFAAASTAALVLEIVRVACADPTAADQLRSRHSSGDHDDTSSTTAHDPEPVASPLDVWTPFTLPMRSPRRASASSPLRPRHLSRTVSMNSKATPSIADTDRTPHRTAGPPSSASATKHGARLAAARQPPQPIVILRMATDEDDDGNENDDAASSSSSLCLKPGQSPRKAIAALRSATKPDLAPLQLDDGNDSDADAAAVVIAPPPLSPSSSSSSSCSSSSSAPRPGKAKGARTPTRGARAAPKHDPLAPIQVQFSVRAEPSLATIDPALESTPTQLPHVGPANKRPLVPPSASAVALRHAGQDHEVGTSGPAAVGSHRSATPEQAIVDGDLRHDGTPLFTTDASSLEHQLKDMVLAPGVKLLAGDASKQGPELPENPHHMRRASFLVRYKPNHTYTKRGGGVGN